MSQHSYAEIDVALIEANTTAMRALRDTLAQMGVRNTHTFTSAAGVVEALTQQPPDLAIVDVDHVETDGFRLIRRLRNDAAFPNPFVCVIATTWQPTEALFQKVTNSGADALLVKPASPKQVMDRVAALVETRRTFVVSVDYVGPDRRKNPREGAQVATLDPPNSLALKVQGQWERAGGKDQIARGIVWLNEQKMVRVAFHIGFLIEYARPGLDHTPPERIALDHLMRVPATVEDLLKRATGRTNIDKGFEPACRSLLALVERIHRTPQTMPPAADLAELQVLALAIMGALSPDRPQELLLNEVISSTAVYRKRLDELLAAKAGAAEAK